MELIKNLQPFLNDKKIINYHQSTKNIIDAILKQHQLSLKDYDNIYLYFYDKSFVNVADKIFNFLKKNIKYVVEPENLQTIKTPSAILATGKTTGSDCKNFSLFFAGILDAYRRNTGNNFELCFRFSCYDDSNIPEHVYVVINANSNKPIYCDAVLNYFNEYKKPTFYKDKKINNMALMSLSGITNKNNKIGTLTSVLESITQISNVALPLATNVINVVKGAQQPVFNPQQSSGINSNIPINNNSNTINYLLIGGVAIVAYMFFIKK